jgi:hypothetical protein
MIEAPNKTARVANQQPSKSSKPTSIAQSRHRYTGLESPISPSIVFYLLFKKQVDGN